jgi:hypothetical protein
LYAANCLKPAEDGVAAARPARLKPHEIEDVPCIFKNRFGATVRGVHRS